MAHYLDPILNPSTIVVIGASKDTTKRGNRAIQSLFDDRYSGTIIPINPKEKEILGLPCFPSIAAAPGEIDLAIVCTAAKTVPGVIRECGERKVKGAILLAGGFSEASEEGRVLEEEAIAVARKYGVRLIGPNTNGMFTARLGCNAWGLKDIPRGPLGWISNSANVVTSIVLQARAHGYMGINTMLSVGNQADLYFHEYLDCLGADPAVEAVMLYLEGFKDSRSFMQVARKVTQVKPVVMYVAGRSSEGKRAAKSHSGSLAGDYAVSTGVLRQSGVAVVNRSYHIYPVSEALCLFPPMRGRRVAVLSEGGGPITVAADAIAESGLVLAQLTPETQARIHAIVPNATAISNPVDAGGGTDPRAEYYGSISRIILEDPNIDGLLLVGFFGGYMHRYGDSVAATEQRVCVELGEMMRELGKPIMVQTHYGELRTPSIDVMRKAGIPFQRHVEIAVQCLASAADFHASRRRIALDDAAAPGTIAPAAARILATATKAGRDLLETEARALLAAYGVALAPHALVNDAAGITAAARTFADQAVAVKVVSADILHKSEAGGVKLGVVGEAGLQAACDEITRNATAYKPGARIEGMLVTPMADKGTEVIIGVLRDPQYGPVIVFGLGGVFVEVIRDAVFRALPITPADAREMISELRYGSMLDGARGAPPANREAIAQLLLEVSRIATLHPEIAEIDLNPVIARPEGCTIVDARIVLAKA
jgi:acyl-CoA synthetase (NDP forming)